MHKYWKQTRKNRTKLRSSERNVAELLGKQILHCKAHPEDSVGSTRNFVITKFRLKLKRKVRNTTQHIVVGRLK